MIIKQKAQGRRNASTLQQQQQPPRNQTSGGNVASQVVHASSPGSIIIKHAARQMEKLEESEEPSKRRRTARSANPSLAAAAVSGHKINLFSGLAAVKRFLFSVSLSPLSFSFVANNNLLSAAYMICNCFCCDRPQFIISY